MSDRKYSSLRELLAAHKVNKEIVKLGSVTTFDQQTTGGFDINKLVSKSNHPFKLLKDTMMESVDNLAKAYGISTTVYRDIKMSKNSGEDMFALRYALGTSEVLIVKDYGANAEIDEDMLTPNRFAMILTLAAHDMFDKAKKAEDKDMGMKLKKIMNPFGMFHGFYPEDWENFEDKALNLMMYAYLCTTIGFDALIYRKPELACAIATYRASGDNPVKLGLTTGIDGSIDPEVNPELATRCTQGIYTKKFNLGGQSMKLEDALEVVDFKKKVIAAYRALNANATGPVKKRAVRAAKVVKELVNMTRNLDLEATAGPSDLSIEATASKSPKKPLKAKDSVTDKARSERVSELMVILKNMDNLGQQNTDEYRDLEAELNTLSEDLPTIDSESKSLKMGKHALGMLSLPNSDEELGDEY